MLRNKNTHAILSAVILLVCLGGFDKALAAPHAESTVVPLGQMGVKKGVQEIVVSIGNPDADRWVSPLVLVGVQPLSGKQTENGPPPKQVPATIKFEIAGKKLPDWVLSKTATAYVISPASLRQNAEFANKQLKMTVHCLTDAEECGFVMLAMPDPTLVAKGGELDLNGPIEEFIRTAGNDADIKGYLETLAMEFRGELQDAQKAYTKLAESKNERVARFARRGLRMLSYRLRERQLSGNYLEHLRWGLFLRHAGMYQPAYTEFDEARILFAQDPVSQYYAGESLAMTPTAVFPWLIYLDRSGLRTKPSATTRLNVLITIVKARGNKLLAENDISAIKESFLAVERIFTVATDSRLEPFCTWQIVESEDDEQLVTTADGMLAPKLADSTSQLFDLTVTVIPRLDHENASEFRLDDNTSANEPARAMMYRDGGFDGVAELYHKFLRSYSSKTEALGGLPDFAQIRLYGVQPAPSALINVMGLLRYLNAPDEYLGVQITDTPVRESFLDLWRIDQPKIADAIDRALDTEKVAVTTGKDGKAMVADEPWVTAGLKNGITRMTTWAYLPESRRAQMRFESVGAGLIRINGQPLVQLDENLQREARFLGASFEKGWNVIEVFSSSAGKGELGVALSLLEFTGKPIPGLANAHTPPDGFKIPATNQMVGEHYHWFDVKDDWRRLLPLLELSELDGFSNWQSVSDGAAHAAFIKEGQSGSPRYRAKAAGWNGDQFSDVVLNNVIDWRREWCGVVESKANGKMRQLLLVRPEGIDGILHCLAESKAEKEIHFNNSPISERLLGYVEVELNDSRQALFVLDVALGDVKNWPSDEEDLLSPFGPFIPNDQYFSQFGPPLPAAN